MQYNQLIAKLFFITFLGLFFSPVSAEEKNFEYNVYLGMFDFSDDGKRAALVGFEHIDKDLNKDTFLGNLSPITGIFVTKDSAAYFYTGVKAKYKLGTIDFTPSFAPGLYRKGNGKDLGHVIEFKTELQISLDLSTNSKLGFSYNHLSNASLGSKNPGANSYIFNFFKIF
mgnify:FL=1|tara:strand:+ start:35 stop:544 length:510 start_codon:yes stop_codon:yes gene_type:complete